MRELLLFRHAKSRWDVAGVHDHDRDLTPRGERAARRMGKLLAEHGLLPDRVLCSTARRAKRTWELAAAELPDVPSPAFDRALYLAEPQRLLDIVRRAGDGARRLLVVGHNPGIHAFAMLLLSDGPAEARARLAAKFPTAALAQIACDAASWAKLGAGSGRLVAFWRPRDLD